MGNDVVPQLESSATPLDLPTTTFSQALERRGSNRTALISWVRSHLVSDVDYGVIQIRGRPSKPSLRKPGAEKICGMLGVIATFPSLPEYEKAAYSGVPIGQVILRCHLIDPNGRIVADGIGGRSVDQDGGDLNKALKMCAKSAMIDATLRMAGLSEIFTQDLEDMPQGALDADKSDMGRPIQTATTPAISAPKNQIITDKRSSKVNHDADDYPTRGKYRREGECPTPWRHVSADYLTWVLSSAKTPQELKDGCKAELDRRSSEAEEIVQEDLPESFYSSGPSATEDDKLPFNDPLP